MSIILAIALLQGATQVNVADTFAARVTRGKMIEAGPAGPAYQKALWAKIHDPTTIALKGCLASNAPADTSPFTLVADVQPDGRPSRVVVEPATPVASCLAGWLASLTLPPPPKLAHDAIYPIEIDFSIVP